ncbi:hypothetical protein D3C87_1896290 [compost metagenome]
MLLMSSDSAKALRTLMSLNGGLRESSSRVCTRPSILVMTLVFCAFSMRSTSAIGTRWMISTSPCSSSFTRVPFSGMNV